MTINPQPILLAMLAAQKETASCFADTNDGIAARTGQPGLYGSTSNQLMSGAVSETIAAVRHFQTGDLKEMAGALRRAVDQALQASDWGMPTSGRRHAHAAIRQVARAIPFGAFHVLSNPQRWPEMPDGADEAVVMAEHQVV